MTDEAMVNLSIWISSVAAAAALFGAIVPWWNRRNELLLQQAILSMERAYAALTDSGTHNRSPRSDRLNWLTAARHIQRYKSIKRRIRFTPLYRLLCEEHESYWCHQFHIALKGTESDLDYYGEKGTPTAIDPKSAVIIHHFSEWASDERDPIHAVEMEQLLKERPIVAQRYWSLRLYLERPKK